MQKMKKGVAVALAATMVLGSTVTAFAADTNSGSTTGTGTSEGHVDKHVINVELPVVPTGSTPFAYTMDAERLIQETDGAKHANATFPEAASDTGVYFLTGTTEATTVYKKMDSAPSSYTGTDFDSLAATLTQAEYDALDDSNGEKSCYTSEAVPAGSTYDNTSEELKVTNKSSADVDLTVEVTAASQASDITLVDAAPADTVTDPQLYLGLKVGSQTKAIKKGETTKAEVRLDGTDENFETTVGDDGNYVYKEKTVAEGAPALTWDEESISLTGAVSKASAKDLTAPTLTVTWKYEDPAAAPETVEGGIFYESSTNNWWFGTSDSAGFESGITLGAVTVNGQPITGTKTEFEGEDWVVIKWSDYVAAGYDRDETEFDFTAVVNGITYTAHYTYGG